MKISQLRRIIREELNRIEKFLGEERTRRKPLQIYATAGVNNIYGGPKLIKYITMMRKLFAEYPYDMFVIEYDKKKRKASSQACRIQF